VAKDQPKPAVASKSPEPLPDFDKFCLDMKPYLSRVRHNDVDLILRSLYRAAEMKVGFESLRLSAQAEVPGLRRYRKKMAAAKSLISQALKLLAKVDRDVRQELVAERLGEGDGYVLYPFDEIVEFLDDAAQCAESSRLAFVCLLSRPSFGDNPRNGVQVQLQPFKRGGFELQGKGPGTFGSLRLKSYVAAV
jgi:hypothetical protein